MRGSLLVDAGARAEPSTPGDVNVETSSAEEGRAPSELRALALAVLGLALSAVVGLASSASAWHADPAASAPATALQALAAAGGVVLVLALLLLWVATPAAPRRRKKRRTPAAGEFDAQGRSFWSAPVTVAVVLLALAVFCIATLPLLSPPSGPPPGAVDTLPSERAEPPPGQGGSPGELVDLGWLLLPIAVALTLLAPVAFLVRRRRLKRDRVAPAEEQGELGRAVRASIAELESERDPRRAIRRAYARMEESFGDVEIVRARDETASEFLGRNMRRLQVSADAAAALTGRFEEVRYSTHEITEADREQALSSLRRVERELARP